VPIVSFRPVLVLWGRLVSFACTTVLLLSVVTVLAGIDGWLKFDTPRELLREIGARLTLSLAFGACLGTVATLLTFPFVLRRRDLLAVRCQRLAQRASSAVALLFAIAVLGILIHWSTRTELFNITNRAAIMLWVGVSGLLVAGYLLYPVLTRREVRVSPDFIQTFAGPMTRRILLIGFGAGLLTAFSDIPTTSRPVRQRRAEPMGRSGRPMGQPGRPMGQPNIILVTFDALSAEDMSCYGYRLDTTPNLAALARESNLFTNYYATSTFTTPNVISMLTGRYPSSSGVYHYGGRLHGIEAERTLPRELLKAGYRTAASVANPGAHPGCLGFDADFDELPPPPISDFATRAAAAEFHSALLADDAGVAARLVPYTLEQISPRLFGQRKSSTPPALSFQQAAKLLANAGAHPDQPYFLWVHTYAPHFPYLPDPPYLHRFLPGDELRTHAEFADMVDLKGYWYSPSRQPIVDKARLRYNEWMAQADGACGEFLAMLRTRGHLDNTALIVSADHGESFAGGFVGHGGAMQRRPILHIPLLIRLPGQTRGRVIADVLDQTALAPTILELAGLPRPVWMDGESHAARLSTDTNASPSLAFTQYLEPNSVFAPIKHGTVGVIDGHYQYLLVLDRDSGALYPLAEADRQSVDRTASEPAVAAQLRARIAARFPSLSGGRV